MITEIKEGSLKFSFPAGCQASKYDDWSFYRNQFQPVAKGCKAVDILCIAEGASWLIEVKDYRLHSRTKVIDPDDGLAIKIRDTLAGLASAAKSEIDDDQCELARNSLARKRRWRAVLHLEQPAYQSRLRPKPIDTANLLLKLKTKKLKAVDAHPIICDRGSVSRYAPWTVK